MEAKTGAAMNRGASKQDYMTPPEMIAAVAKRFGPISFDLAAHAGNARHARYFGPREFITKTGSKKTGDLVVTRRPNTDPCEAFDSLAQDWYKIMGLLWLNPEFSDIEPWAEKCAYEAGRGAEIVMLVPASVGANWFRDHVAKQASVYFLNGRVCFDGESGFPKDCMICHYDGRATAGPPKIWSWTRNEIHRFGR